MAAKGQRNLFTRMYVNFLGVFIVGAKRTAFGTFGGKLKNVTATDLGVVSYFLL